MAKSHFMTYELDQLQAVLFLIAMSCGDKVGGDETHLCECRMQCFDAVLHPFYVQHLQDSEWQTQLLRYLVACSWQCMSFESKMSECTKGMRWKLRSDIGCRRCHISYDTQPSRYSELQLQ